MKNKIIYISIIISCLFCFISVNSDSIESKLDYNDTYGINLLANENSNTDCSTLGSFGQDLQSIFNVFKIVAPLLTLALSSYDFVVSITSKQAEGLQKSAKKFTTRLALVVLLYLLPSVLNFLLELTLGQGNTCVS